METAAPAITVRPPPLIRAAKLVVDDKSALHVDNSTGRIVHDKKVERALAHMGIDPYGEGDLPEEPILIKRKKGGPRINPVLIDLVTAGMLVAVWDGLNDANRARIGDLVRRYGANGVVNRFWKLVK